MIRLVFNFEMHRYANSVLSNKDPRCASLFLSYTVGNQIKRYVDDVNCDKMIDSSLNSYRMLVTKQQSFS